MRTEQQRPEMAKWRTVNCYRCQEPIPKSEQPKVAASSDSDTVFVCEKCKMKARWQKLKLKKRVV